MNYEAEIVLAEIEALHQFFERWFTGSCERSDAVFQQGLSARLSDDIVLIQPNGRALGKSTFCNAVQSGFGGSPEFRVKIRNLQLRPIRAGETILATYEEWQRGAVNSTPPDNGRAATVVFERSDTGALLWTHIHETWLPEERYDADAFDF